MKRSLLALPLVSVIAATSFAQPAPRDEGPNRAQVKPTDAGAPRNDAGRAALKDAGPLKDASAPMPPGHPAVDGEGPANPHAGANPHEGHSDDGMPDIPQDSSAEDPTLAKGSIVVRAVDGEGRPIPKAEVTLGILENSVAKGENRKRVLRIANDEGIATFDGLTTGSGIAYRVMALREGATFSMMPFQLGDKGMRAELHIYPVVEEIERASVVAQSAVFFEVKDDRIQAEQAFMLFNFGKNAWKPKDLVIQLPKGHRAVTSQQGMTDVGVDPVENQGVRLRGTFSPGQHQVTFRWQLPYEGEETFKIDLGLPPNLATARVIAAASSSMKLLVDGFPAAMDQTNDQGERALITEKRMTRQDKATDHLDITLAGIPRTGLAREVIWGLTALVLAALAWVSVSAVRSTRAVQRSASKGTKERILEALLDLERAHQAGDVGPKTYEKERRMLIDELARTFA